MPASTSASTAYVTIGRSYSGSRCLFVMRVSGASRLPAPPARITPFIALNVMLFGLAALAVVVDHHPHEPGETDVRYPAKLLARLRGVAEEQVDLGWAEVPLVDLHVLLPREAGVAERLVEELAHRMRLARGEDVIVGCVCLEHPPGAFHVVAREAPVALRVEVPEPQVVLLAAQDGADRPRDLARHEGRASPRRFVGEQDPVHRVHPVRLAVVARDPVGEDLADAV